MVYHTLEPSGNSPKSPSARSTSSSQVSEEPFVISSIDGTKPVKKKMPPKKGGTPLDGVKAKPPPRSAARYETKPEEDDISLTKKPTAENGTSNLLSSNKKKESNYLKGPKRSLKFDALENETMNSPHFANLQTRDGDASSDFSDWIAYKIENAVASDSNVRFYILFGFSGFFCVVLAACWNLVTKKDEFPETHDFWGAGNNIHTH